MINIILNEYSPYYDKWRGHHVKIGQAETIQDMIKLCRKHMHTLPPTNDEYRYFAEDEEGVLLDFSIDVVRNYPLGTPVHLQYLDLDNIHIREAY